MLCARWGWVKVTLGGWSGWGEWVRVEMSGHSI